MTTTKQNDIFNIDNKRSKSPKRIKLSKVWTEEEKNEKIKGFLEIPVEYWSNIKYGTYINYINSKNEFKIGGFVLKSLFIYKNDLKLMIPEVKLSINEEDSDKRKGIQLQSSPYRNKSSTFFIWVVPYDDIKTIYVKTDASIKVLLSSMEMNIENNNINVNKLLNYIKFLDEKIKLLEEKVKMIEKNNTND